MPFPLPPAIMVQGTSSNAGKSLLTAALCRVFADMGLKAMPFKAQNMTSYAHTLPSGRLMSGAQALQAWAARQTPDERMNPVLLKPSAGLGSEVFVLGESLGTMNFAEYTTFKPRAFAAVVEAYASLARGTDLMLIEGAGSPAEINLKDHDIVNMRMARHAGASVLLVTDIDRGGAFAHLAGTHALLPPEEQALFAGFILNKFRGDASLLSPALERITALTGVPFAGVIPLLPDTGLPEEDSLSLAANAGGTACLPERADLLEPALNRLAAHVQGHMDMNLLIRLARGERSGNAPFPG